jgi:Organic solute transporter Ostalpha
MNHRANDNADSNAFDVTNATCDFPDILRDTNNDENIMRSSKTPNIPQTYYHNQQQEQPPQQTMVRYVSTEDSSIHRTTTDVVGESSLQHATKIKTERQESEVEESMGTNLILNDDNRVKPTNRFNDYRPTSHVRRDDFTSLLRVDRFFNHIESSVSNRHTSNIPQQQRLKPRASSFSETNMCSVRNRQIQLHHSNDYPTPSFVEQNNYTTHNLSDQPPASIVDQPRMTYLHTITSPYETRTRNNNRGEKEIDENRCILEENHNDMTRALLLSDYDFNIPFMNDKDQANNTNDSNSNNMNSSSVMSNIEHFMNSTMIIWNEIWNIQSHDEFISWFRIWLRQLLRRMGNYLAYCTLIIMLILVPVVLYNALALRKLDTAAYNSAYIMVCGTIVLSTRLVYLHLTHWYMPQVQKYVVRILWMVPIYAIQSYLSLRFHNSRVYITSIRDFYEAYVIASFVYYLMELLGGQESIIMILQRKDPNVYGKHVFPFRFVLKEWQMGLEFMLQCKYGVLQYVVFKTTLTVLVFFCESIGIYGEGRFEWYFAYPYFCFFQNISVMYALYCLVLFFHVVNDELMTPINWHPLGKFLCIKGVVFVSFTTNKIDKIYNLYI